MNALDLPRPLAPRDALTPPPAVTIHGVATAYPPHVLQQDEIMAEATKVFAHRPQLMARMVASYGNAGVRTRNSSVPLSWYGQPHGWPERMKLFEDNAVALLTEAARKAMAASGVDPSQIGATVTACSTGIVTPCLDSLLQGPLGLSPNTQRLPVFGLGCAGGVIGLSRAAALARATPGQWVLFMCTELCSLTFRAGDDSKSNVIATTIFGDGAAAMLLRAGSYGDAPAGRTATIRAWGEHTWPDTRDVMGWAVQDDGLGVIFSRHIPTLVREKMRPVTDAFLAQHGLSQDDLDGLIVHPGGEKVIAAIEAAYDLPSGELADARAVMAAHGNMSAVTVLAVFERALQSQPPGRYLMTALGPGFSVGMALVDLA